MSCNSPKIKVLGAVFLNEQGHKYYSKYFMEHCTTKLEYDCATAEGRDQLEKNLIFKIFPFSNLIVLLRTIDELQVFLLCEDEENYFLMENAINCIFSVLQLATSEPYLGKTILSQLPTIVTVVDEVFDQGIIVTLDPALVFDRIKMKDSCEPTKIPATQAPPAAGGAFSSIFGFAKSSLQRTLNLG